jgi:uncharacterized membrane protein YphA (DoxX/SURF4 family)
MALSRRLARPLLASIFVAGGIDALRNPAGKAEKADPVTEPLSEGIGFVPEDPETLVRINGAVQIGAGLLLATGKFRRLASLALIGSIIPTTYAGHRFWEETEEVARAQQRMHFLKNVGLLGGLILAAVDTEGEPSLGWRTKRRVHQLEAAVAIGRAAGDPKSRRAARRVKRSVSNASVEGFQKGRTATRHVARSAKRAGLDSATKAAAAATVAAKLADSTGREGLRHFGEIVSDARESGAGAQAGQQALSAVATAARHLEPLAQASVRSGLDVAGPYLASLNERAGGILTGDSN